MKTLYAAASPQERTDLSRAVCAQLALHFGLDMASGAPASDGPAEWTNAQHVPMLAAFSPRLDEPDIRPFVQAWISSGRRVCFPLCVTENTGAPVLQFHEVRNMEEDLKSGFYGLREPDATLAGIAPGNIDAVLVPGIAFDRNGGRLGRGKGYYDRFLAACPQALTLAPAFPWQVVEEVPMEPHDARIRGIALPEGIVSCTSPSVVQ